MSIFSSRVPSNLEPNRIAHAVARARLAGRPFIDLTVTNPTSVGIDYPSDVLHSLASVDALRYEPAAFGLDSARAAVSADYARRGIDVDPARVVLTSSTSEAYSLLFKLLCAPEGDAVLVPTPSYPLFEHLTVLDGVQAICYGLDFHGRWTVGFDNLDRAWTKRVRAVLAVSPNNPTGSVLSAAELEALALRCAERRTALIVDEVFADYLLAIPTHAMTASPVQEDWPARCLTFRLGGLSKSVGLPQVKLGWIAVGGPDVLVRDALARLEVICDAYLSVSTPVQVAAPSLIAAGASVRASILERIRVNADTIVSLAAAHPAVQALPVDGGWSAVLRVPSTRPEETLVLELLERDDVLVHPGFFFDFPHEAFVVCSLLPDSRLLRDGIGRLLERVGA